MTSDKKYQQTAAILNPGERPRTQERTRLRCGCQRTVVDNSGMEMPIFLALPGVLWTFLDVSGSGAGAGDRHRVMQPTSFILNRIGKIITDCVPTFVPTVKAIG